MVWGLVLTGQTYMQVWLELMDSLFVGASEQIPYIRHNLYFEEWQALDNLLLHGFNFCVYFPIQLSKVFVMFCLFSEAPDNSILQ